ncbi:MAG: hypothetical protein WAM97_12875 [Acidimicrobiales bacterium]
MLRTKSARSGSLTSMPRSGKLRAAGIVSFLGCLGILLAACSSGSANASTSTSTTTAGSKTGPAAFTAYLDCLKNHGVTSTGRGGFPGAGGGGGFPGAGGPGSSTPSNVTTTTLSASQRSAYEKAASACASLRPKFNGFGGGGTGTNTAFDAYRNCLKLHGVTLPTRGAGGFGGFGGGGSTSSTSTTSNPTLQAAETACASLRPKPGAGAGGFPGSTTTTTAG